MIDIVLMTLLIAGAISLCILTILKKDIMPFIIMFAMVWIFRLGFTPTPPPPPEHPPHPGFPFLNAEDFDDYDKGDN